MKTSCTVSSLKYKILLFGIPVGIMDLIHIDGLPTRASSNLPPLRLINPIQTVNPRFTEGLYTRVEQTMNAKGWLT